MKVFDSAKSKIILITSFLYLLSADVVLAQFMDPTRLNNPITYNSIDGLLSAILGFIINIGSPLIVLALVYAGFKFISARGNPTKIEEAKDILLYVLIGAVLILGAQALKIVITGTVSSIQSGL
jgi:uncharacterized membrane protein YidH (DUF202 family)